MATTVERKCEDCGKTIHPRKSDVARGWGRFCNKRCKARFQEKKTGQYARLQQRVIDEPEQGWDAHKEIL